jgi:predicted AAA+ superfamily ATPase
MVQFKRFLKPPDSSFFLFGPRGTGKSTWLQREISAALFIDLLESDRYLELSIKPSRVLELCAHLKSGDWVVIDEIQKIPALLDEVHWLYQKKNLNFAITGSSARKLKRTHANLLAGRLLDLKFYPLTFPELGSAFNIEKCLEFGSLPGVAKDYHKAVPILASYLSTYLRQELLEESVIRNLDPFRRFIDVVGQFNGQLLNKETIARESSVKRTTIDHYFGILEDTLMGTYVPSWNPGLKSKEAAHPKFYLFDTGIVRACAGLLNQELESEYLGFMFETFVLGQLRAYLNQSFKYFDVYHYSITQSYDIDFVIQTKKPVMSKRGELALLEIKYGRKFRPEWIKGIVDFRNHSKDKIRGNHVIYTGKDRLEVEGVQIWPAAEFLKALFDGEIIG